jgi:hypothetical protein
MMVLNGSRQNDALDGGQSNDDCHGQCCVLRTRGT